jgi:sulfite reductase (ferredoxin)
VGHLLRELKEGRCAVASEPRELTAVEGIKEQSDHLRGDLATQLASSEPNVSESSEQLLKFHGIYAQDDRDVRRERSLAKETLEYIFMIRVAIPGGRLSSKQWLALDHIAGEIADGTIRLTTRQAVQYHGVRKGGLRPLARVLDEHLMTSFGACGDVVRNIVACPGLQTEPGGNRLRAITDHLATAFKPRTQAHWEIFVDGERAASKEVEEEHDFYGDTYLPRKFKIAIAHPGDNCVDVFAQDLGLVPGTHPELGEGFTVLVGGGLGRSYANPDTFARLADPLSFVTDDELDGVIAAVLATYRDLGDRTDRRRARMKYVVADRGIEAFRSEVEARLGAPLRAPLAVMPDIGADDHLGWRISADGSHQVGIRVGAGRVRDEKPDAGLRTALRKIAASSDVTFLITPQQDLLIAGIAGEDRDRIGEILEANAVAGVEELGPVERNALACPALPTCGQALAEAERRLPDLVDLLEGELASRPLAGRRLQLRMTGCPNGCARPAVAEVGVVGRTKTSYDLFVGGGPSGDRLAVLFREKVKFDDIPAALAPLLDRWAAEAGEQEAFGDFIARAGIDEPGIDEPGVDETGIEKAGLS